jgi:hypothetical protein
MRLPSQTLRRAGPLSRLILPALTLALVGGPVTANEPKTHVLYLGADFSVVWKGKPRPVIDLEGESLVIDVDGVRTPLRTSSAQVPIQMKPVMKLSQGSAEVTGLQGGPVFSAENNPHRASEQGAMMAQDASAVADLASFNLRLTETALGANEQEQLGGSPDKQAALASAQQAVQDSRHAAGSTTHSPLGQSSGSATAFDALLVNFVVATPHVLDRPYAMVFVRYFEQPDNPQTARVRIFPMALARVDSKPRRYHLLRAGLPPGYQLDRYAVHLFEGGAEIAASTSARRVELTADEAFQFAVVGHLTDLKDRTQAPLPARDFWPADLAARLSEGNRNRLVYVRVNKDGLATGAYHDADGKLPVTDADIVALLPELRFLPALNQGKPGPGMCRVNLGERDL